MQLMVSLNALARATENGGKKVALYFHVKKISEVMNFM